MNWTGGRLQRHSTAASSANNRQKQHFVMVQQNLRNSSKAKPPIRWEIFGLVAEDTTPRPRASRGPSQQPHAPQLQRDAVVPAHHQQRSQQERIHSIPRPSSQHHVTSIKREHILDHDIYKITRPTKRQRTAPKNVSGSASPKETCQDQESMLERRRNILERGDWVGVNIQKPLQLTFAPPGYQEKIGRRRRIKGNHRARFRDTHARIASPFASGKEFHEAGPRRHAKADVRISIGGKEVPPGISSSSMRRSGSHPSVRNRRSLTISSDVMLLDNHQAPTGVEAYGTGRSTPMNGIHNNESDPYSSHKPRYQNLSEVDSVDNDNLRAHSRNTRFNQQWIENTSKAQNEFKDYSDDYKAHHLPGNRSEPVLPELGHLQSIQLRKNRRPGRLYFSSSSTLIHHPKPQSSKVSVLLRSGSSELAESNVAQVGQVNSAVSRSQLLDNEIWRTWIAPDSEELETSSSNHGHHTTEAADGVCISPGISMAACNRNSSRAEGEEISHCGNPTKLRRQHSGQVAEDKSSHRPFPRSSSLDTPDVPPESEVRGRSLDPPIESVTAHQKPLRPNYPKAAPLSQSVDNQELIELSRKPLIEAPASDDVWRKFVFGSDSNDGQNNDTVPEFDKHRSHEVLDMTIASSSVRGASIMSFDRIMNTTTAGTYNSSEVDSPVGEHRHQTSSEKNSTNIVYRKGSAISTTSLEGQATSEFASRNPPNGESTETGSGLLFARPTPFDGRKIAHGYAVEETSPTYGLGKFTKDRQGKESRRRSRIVRDLNEPHTNIERCEVESIEDD